MTAATTSRQHQGPTACVFDAYGTLFDVHTAVTRHRARLGAAADRLSAVWRTKQLEYTWLRSLMHRHADFWEVTTQALDFAFDTVGVADPGLRDDLLHAYLRLDCYPDVTPALTTLKQRGLQTAILSNGSPGMLEAATRHAGLEALIDLTLSVEAVGVYKPHPRVYQLAVERLGVPVSEISFQSANAWDAAGAASFGLSVIWINRFGQRAERLPGRADAVVASLAELPARLHA